MVKYQAFQDNAHNPKVLTAQINCMDCPKSSNLPRELVELNEMVLSRMIKAKKMSFRRQYECGMLTTSAMKALDDMADEAASRRKELTSGDVQQYLKSHISTIFVRQCRQQSPYIAKREAN